MLFLRREDPEKRLPLRFVVYYIHSLNVYMLLLLKIPPFFTSSIPPNQCPPVQSSHSKYPLYSKFLFELPSPRKGCTCGPLLIRSVSHVISVQDFRPCTGPYHSPNHVNLVSLVGPPGSSIFHISHNIPEDPVTFVKP